MSDELQVVFLLGMVGAAYLLAHFVVGWFQRRFLTITGIEYILLGAVLGPEVVPGVRALADLEGLAPIIAFAAGWVGLLYGVSLDLRALSEAQDRAARLAAFDVVVTGAGVGGLSYLALSRGWVLPGVAWSDAAVASWVLACAAAAGSTSAVDLVRLRYRALETELLPLLHRAARMGDVAAIVGFGLLFCAFHVEGPGQAMAGLALFDEWLVRTVVLGVGLGWLFAIFLGDTEDANHRFLALSGIIIFASGAAFFLKLSALLVNLLLGLTLGLTRHGRGLTEVLESTQAPVRLVLLVFAGALWVPVPMGPAVALSAGYVALRVLAKFAGGSLATVGTPLRSDVFRGMLAQGDVAVAIAIGFRLVYRGPAADLAYTAILVSVVIHEMVAPRLLKGLLIDAGELRHDIDTMRPAPQREVG